ncbi:MAG: hypothetical protein QHC67_13685 [Sphingobium sp.]|uniref:hypothetical protein n=1 Tax=Sphingobium sp. TaxID=1912891 RepID=UPI0029AC268C|nr:hypothetical protein [Sphingobium sp.]MDX3910852.1 hypothetical protein [Sphingobium sp.]
MIIDTLLNFGTGKDGNCTGDSAFPLFSEVLEGAILMAQQPLRRAIIGARNIVKSASTSLKAVTS